MNRIMNKKFKIEKFEENLEYLKTKYGIFNYLKPHSIDLSSNFIDALEPAVSKTSLLN